MITAIIPACNAARFLRQCLDSVLAQTFEAWEAVVVDDGSSDSTLELAQIYARQDTRIRVEEQSNAGPSAARNRGARLASDLSEYLLFLDADDVLDPCAFELLVSALQASPDAAGSYGLAHLIDEDGETIERGSLEGHQRDRHCVVDDRVVPWPLDRPTTFAVEAVTESIITAGTVLIRRAAFDRSRGWAEDIRLWEDWDLWLRLTRIGDLIFLNEPVLGYRRHGANLSGNDVALEAGERDVRKRLLVSLLDEPGLLRIATIGARAHHRRLIAGAVGLAVAKVRQVDFVSAAMACGRAIRLLRAGAVRAE